MQTVVFLLLVFANQACIYVLRTDGRHLLGEPASHVGLAHGCATGNTGCSPDSTCALFALLLDQAKRIVFPRFVQ